MTNRNSRVLPDKSVLDIVSIVFIAPSARNVAGRRVRTVRKQHHWSWSSWPAHPVSLGVHNHLRPKFMITRKRKGMVIKNTNTYVVNLAMETRTIAVAPGASYAVTSEEVLDADLRAKLQVRDLSIVRPTTDEEETELRATLAESSTS